MINNNHTCIKLPGDDRPITEAWFVNEHGEGHCHRHQPGQQDGGVGDEGPGPGAPRVTHRGEHGLEPVQTDPDHAVDGGGAEDHVRRDPGLAEPRPQAPGLRPGGDHRGHHHQQRQA